MNAKRTFDTSSTTMIRMEEKKLVNHILQGDERSLRVYYDRYRPQIARFIRQRVSNEQDAEELLQDVLLASLDALRDFSFRSSLMTFLCGIAIHKTIDYYRRKKIKHIVFSKLPDIELLLSTLQGPEEALDTALLREHIAKTFEKLTPTARNILHWKYIYGYSVDEIAQRLSTTFKSAESQLFRARKAFAAAYMLDSAL